ncbi:MAG: radical SAM protein [Nitrososphaerota archaeon]
MLRFAKRIPDRCSGCNTCEEIVACPAGKLFSEDLCFGCGACQLACPGNAVRMLKRTKTKDVEIKVNAERFWVPERITIKAALEFIGYKFSSFPEKDSIFAPCSVGGCYSCAVLVNGELMPSCVTGIKEGMEISTELPEDYVPKRIVHGWMGHPVGGVGTPWWLKGDRYIEVACFACGCNLRCPQCQNWTTTYCGKDRALSPFEAARITTYMRKVYRVNRMAISGGESTLNRRWLLNYVKALKELNQDSDARIHIDTNATILTRDYIDELVDAGMTDIGPDLKGLKVETFMRITGIENRELAERYLRTSWDAFRYLVDNYKERLFIGIGIPYNRVLISMEEIIRIGEEVAKIDDNVQVCVLDYRPEFRNVTIPRPSYTEMLDVWKALKGVGLKTVICQTSHGHIGP